MKLPNGNQANLGSKIEAYCLNINHEKGKHKAILFSKFGITLKNAKILKDALLTAAIKEDVTLMRVNDYGNYYNMKFWFKTENGESLILAAGIIRKGENFPRLINCYPLKK